LRIRHLLCVCCFLLLAGLALSIARPSFAYAPQAAAAIATLAPRALPPAAHWEALWRDAAAAAVERRLEDELRFEADDSVAESLASLHRCTADGMTDALAPGDAESRAIVFGAAPAELEAAALELRDAFAGSSPVRIVQAIARIAVTSADLADPFLTTSPLVEERPGVQARFSDLLEAGDLEALTPADIVLPDDLAAAARQVAAESAALRDSVESAAELGDGAWLDRLRRERLSVALALAGRIVIDEWSAAGSPALLDPLASSGATRVLPTPTRGPARLWFSLPRGGLARFELYDVAGRSVVASELGFRSAGPQELQLDGSRMNALHPGLYFTRISVGSYRTIGRLIIVHD
jgi:hypothetical protein